MLSAEEPMTALQNGVAILLLPAVLSLTCCTGASRAPPQPQDDCAPAVVAAMDDSTETTAVGSVNHPAPELALRCW